MRHDQKCTFFKKCTSCQKYENPIAEQSKREVISDGTHWFEETEHFT